MTRFLRISALLTLSAILIGGIALYFVPKPPLLQNLSFSQAVYDNRDQLLRLTLTSDDKYRLYTPLSNISPYVIKATLLQEDRYFYRHPGMNPWALIKATWNTYIIGERRFGGSTITMQVARIRYDINSKTISGKLWQILRAIQLERHYSKNKILEAYLNLAPYSGNIEGVGAASLAYFHRPVKNLTLPEAILLTVIPQNPTLRKPTDPENSKARQILTQQWQKIYPLDATQKAMLALPIQTYDVKNLPYLAPHFVNDLLGKSPSSTLNITSEIKTTLNSTLQKNIERISRDYVARKRHLGVENAAVLLIDNNTMEVKAMLGSVDFMNASIAGQVNGTTAKRSPGSVLKPFIYALAMDQGVIHPYTVLKDAPRSFGSYNPENFDQEFLGPIKAKDALILSRNIPAVYLSDQIKKPSLHQFLKQAGVSALRAESFYGLALALGGAEMTMEELAKLYGLLVNRGFLKPLRKQISDPVVRGTPLLSPEAAFLTWDILRQHAQPTSNTSAAWKTGTSSGFRDAWSVGLFDKYIIVVWVGNFTGVGNPAFVGKEVAAPLMFEIINAISPSNKLAPKIESGLVKVPVCEVSGMLPTRHCRITVDTWFIPGKSPIQTDTIHREVMIDRQTGLRACRFDKNHIFKVYEFWPSDILKLFQQAGVARRIPPPFSPDCTSNAIQTSGLSQEAPHIRSPQSEVVYSIKPGETNMTISLMATTDTGVKIVHWFADETYLGARSPEQPLLWLAKPGRFVIRVVDDLGRSDARDIEVKIAS
jgi:penicillin-binding protein 1C